MIDPPLKSATGNMDSLPFRNKKDRQLLEMTVSPDYLCIWQKNPKIMFYNLLEMYKGAFSYKME